MKVYVETNPETIYSGRVKDEVKTSEIRMWFETDEEIEVQSLAEYTKQVRKDVCNKVYNVFTNQNMWRALKDWWLNAGNCKELKDCLNDIANDLSVSDVVKKNTNHNQLLALIEALEGANYDKN